MATFSSHDAAQALQILATAAIDRRSELEAYGEELLEDSDEDTGTDALIFHNGELQCGEGRKMWPYTERYVA